MAARLREAGRGLAIGWLLLAMLLGFAGPAHAEGQRVALVIGVSRYEHVAGLDSPAVDAGTVAKALRDAAFDVTEITDPKKLGMRALLDAVTAFRAKADKADAAVIYFSGHGLEIEGTNWLLPGDADAPTPDDLEGNAIRAAYLMNAVRLAHNVRLVILDACRSNPFLQRAGWSSSQRSVALRGLSRDESRPANVVLMLATQPGMITAPGSKGGPSPFAASLADIIRTPGAFVGEVPKLISDSLRTNYKIDQTPDQQGILDAPEWTFIAPARPSMAAATPTTPTIPTAADAGALATATCGRIETSPALAGRGTIQPCIDALALDPHNAVLMQSLGQSYEAAKDRVNARKWYSQSAMNGNSNGLISLGNLCSGTCAFDYYSQAAKNGDVNAMLLAAESLMIGRVIDINDQTVRLAFYWLKRASERGNSKANDILNKRFQNWIEK